MRPADDDVERGAEETFGRHRARARSALPDSSTGGGFRARMGSLGSAQLFGSFSGVVPADDRKASNAAKAQALGQIMRAADFSPTMLICYSLESGALTYANHEVLRAAQRRVRASPCACGRHCRDPMPPRNLTTPRVRAALSPLPAPARARQVFRVLGPAVEVGKPVEALLDGAFRRDRDPDAVRALFGIGLGPIDGKRSALELASAAGNALPALLFMRVNPGDAVRAPAAARRAARLYPP